MTELWDPRLANDLRQFVRFVYPWGKPNTPLASLAGPRNWQDQLLKDISDYIAKADNFHQINKAFPKMFQAAVASGRGIGKSAMFSWLAHWMVTTRLGSSVWVAANGEPQLKTKTFPEIAKWVTLAINSHWFDVMATQILPAKWFSEAVERDMKISPKYWYISAQLWSEENPDAFAGAHNGYGEMALFDEASGIPSPIWTVQSGVFTEPTIDRYWLAFSNPRRNNGAFYECFHGADRVDWLTRNIDSRSVDVPQDQFESIIRKHGVDSDEARIEVYGQFPSSGLNQFIGTDEVRQAMDRVIVPDPGAPLLMGVDVARFGKDESVIAFRKGRDAKFIPWQVYLNIDTAKLATAVADAAAKYKVDAIFVDGNGVGGGVVDNLKAWGYRVIEVQAGSQASEPDRYLNKRVEMWALMKEWLTIGSLPDDSSMIKDLTGPEYSYHPVTNKLCLETKEKMRDRGVASPNRADALAMTFAQPIARTDVRHSRQNNRSRTASGLDYQILS